MGWALCSIGFRPFRTLNSYFCLTFGVYFISRCSLFRPDGKLLTAYLCDATYQITVDNTAHMESGFWATKPRMEKSEPIFGKDMVRIFCILQLTVSSFKSDSERPQRSSAAFRAFKQQSRLIGQWRSVAWAGLNPCAAANCSKRCWVCGEVVSPAR